MKFRIAMWAVAGLLVAGCWALFVFATTPYANDSMRNLWVLADVTCPIVLVRSRPLSVYSILAANVATYVLVGLIVETLRSFRIAHHKHS
jgi:hypothetical protein